MQRRSSLLGLLLLALILAATAYAYYGLLDADFVTFDDPRYVILNEPVRDGLSLDGVRWAFTTFAVDNWHPLTWLSHMLDVSLFGIEPWGHHLTSILLHLLDTALLFAFLRRATGRLWEAAVVAALFALHPTRVESVAWISERKDVLSTFFGFAALWSYVRYAERTTLARYLPVFVLYALSLMAKPMLVTLPFVLLLLDVWPLERIALGARTGARIEASHGHRATWPRLVLEKLPLVALAAAASMVTLLAQRVGFASADQPSAGARVTQALASYLAYLRLTLWPVGLIPYYPLPSTPPVAAAGLAVIVLGALSLVAWRLRRSCPYALVGWLWFLGTLVPVIGLVRVGGQAIADRYTYVPLVGLFVVLVWGASDLQRRLRVPRPLLAAGVVALLATLTVRTRAQAAFWQSSERLYRHTLEVMPDNSFAHDALATVLLLDDRRDEAEAHLRRAVEIDGKNSAALSKLAALLLERGDVDGAAALAARAVALEPNTVEAQLNLALALERRGDLDGALPHYRAAAELEPQRPGVLLLLAEALEEHGDVRDALPYYRLALRLTPDSERARDGLRRVQQRIRASAARPPDVGRAGGKR